jgi:hypothetical protein
VPPSTGQRCGEASRPRLQEGCNLDHILGHSLHSKGVLDRSPSHEEEKEATPWSYKDGSSGGELRLPMGFSREYTPDRKGGMPEAYHAKCR